MVKHLLHVWCVDRSRVTALTIVTMQTIQVMLFHAVPRFPPGQQGLLVNVTAWDQMIMRNVCCNVDCGVVIRLVRGLLQIAVIIIIILPV